MALKNCTITSTSVDVTKNQAVGSLAHQVLVITPDVGYVVAASDFTKQSPPTGIDTITLSNSGTAYDINNTVLVECDMTNTYNPGNANANLVIDIDGDAVLSQDKPSVRYVRVITNETNTTTSSATTNYTVNGTYGVSSPVTVVSKTITAASGKYFSSEPSYVITTGDSDHYTIENTVTYDATYTDAVTAKTFLIKYNFPNGGSANTNGSPDIITITANADSTLTADDNVKLINFWSGLDSSITMNSYQDTLRVYGEVGAQVNLSMVNEDGTAYNFTDLNFTGGGLKALTIPDDGFIDVPITYPTTTDEDKYDFTLTCVPYSGSDLATAIDSNNDGIALFSVQSYGTCGYTVSTNSASGRSFTSAPSVTHNGTALHKPSTTSTKSSSLTLTDDVNMVLRRLPTYEDLVGTNVDGATNTAGQMGIDSVTVTPSTIGGSGSASLAIAISSNIDQYGITNSTHVLALDNFINVPPVAVSAPYSINEDSGTLNINLASSASDANGDTLTYAIVADNSGSNGALTLTSAANGTVTYVPVLNNNTNVTFTWKCNDGYQDSNVATGTITVVPVADDPTDIALSAITLPENSGAQHVVGVLTATDPDQSYVGSNYSYSLVSGAGDSDNGKFNMAMTDANTHVLRMSADCDFENPADADSNNAYQCRIKVNRSSDNKNFEKAFTITVTDVSDTTTGARWELTTYLANGSVSGIHYVSSTQICQSGSLAIMPGTCFQVNHWVRYSTTAGGCGASYGRGKITDMSIANGTISAYISEAKYYGSSNDSENNTGATNC